MMVKQREGVRELKGIRDDRSQLFAGAGAPEPISHQVDNVTARCMSCSRFPFFRDVNGVISRAITSEYPRIQSMYMLNPRDIDRIM